MFRFVSPLLLCLSALLALSCSVDSASLPDCHPLFPECGDEDPDGDGVVNRDDDFPTDASCSVRDQNNCTGCGRGCGEGEWCSDSYECRTFEDEVCNGEDEDGDGQIDEKIEAPLADNQVGVCEGALQSCIGGGWVSDYSEVPNYEGDFGGVLSDRLDNDCDGDVDEEPPPPCAPNCPDLDFVRIEGGSFMMGDQRSSPDSNEIPVHNVNVPTFEMMRTEITVAQYRACVNASVCSAPFLEDNIEDSQYCTWSFDPSDQEDHPINCVSWYQLMEFAAWMGARLPTEAEWEYAARGQGQDIIYPWGNQSATCQYAVMYDDDDGGNGCGEYRTWPVCSKSAGNTTQGLCDMAGNVYEWVQDEWHSNYNGAPSDGSGWCSGNCTANASDPSYNASDRANRVLRGGGWHFIASILRAAGRSVSDPAYQFNYYGGRLARTVR